LWGDTVIDGYDLTSYLFEGGKESPRTVFFYHATKSVPAGAGLMAVRSGSYKMHLFTQGSHCTSDYPDAMCYAPLANHTASPLLYNLDEDPGEVNLIPPTSALWTTQVKALTALAAAHVKGMVTAPSQIKRGESKERFPCCNPLCEPKPNCCKC
jgi:arylsulfatase A